MHYPKINTVYKRDEMTKEIIDGLYSLTSFALINIWEIEEKIDGTNLCVHYSAPGNDISVYGRSKDSQTPQYIIDAVKALFDKDILKKEYALNKREVYFFGEGYGKNIQSAGPLYRPDVSFMLFDIVVDGVWRDRGYVLDLASKLSLEIPPYLGMMTIDENGCFYFRRDDDTSIPMIITHWMPKNDPIVPPKIDKMKL